MYEQLLSYGIMLFLGYFAYDLVKHDVIKNLVELRSVWNVIRSNP